MATTTDTFGAIRVDTATGALRPRRRLSTETKSAFKTTEFFVYLAAVAGVLIASYLVKITGGHPDYFRADRA